MLSTMLAGSKVSWSALMSTVKAIKRYQPCCEIVLPKRLIVHVHICFMTMPLIIKQKKEDLWICRLVRKLRPI